MLKIKLRENESLSKKSMVESEKKLKDAHKSPNKKIHESVDHPHHNGNGNGNGSWAPSS